MRYRLGYAITYPPNACTCGIKSSRRFGGHFVKGDLQQEQGHFWAFVTLWLRHKHVHSLKSTGRTYTIKKKQRSNRFRITRSCRHSVALALSSSGLLFYRRSNWRRMAAIYLIVSTLADLSRQITVVKSRPSHPPIFLDSSACNHRRHAFTASSGTVMPGRPAVARLAAPDARHNELPICWAGPKPRRRGGRTTASSPHARGGCILPSERCLPAPYTL